MHCALSPRPKYIEFEGTMQATTMGESLILSMDKDRKKDGRPPHDEHNGHQRHMR
jgi:hypothetical protein